MVVTGIGVVSALGADRATTWSALAAGRPGLEPIAAVDTEGLAFRLGGEARDFRPADQLDDSLAHLADRFAQMTIVAAREAAADSGLDSGQIGDDRCAVVTGSCVGGQTTEEEMYARLYRDNRPRGTPALAADTPLPRETLRKCRTLR